MWKTGIGWVCPSSRLLGSAILHRLSSTHYRCVRESQDSFCNGWSCIDKIFTSRQILKDSHVFRRPQISIFLNLKATLDSVDSAVLWCCHSLSGVPEEFISLIHAVCGWLKTSSCLWRCQPSLPRELILVRVSFSQPFLLTLSSRCLWR